MVKLSPQLLIFDVDGVLVEVTRSFHRSALQTVRHFTGRRVTYADFHRWKNRPGYNDDWKLTTDWVAALGHPVPYAAVKRQFEEFYWGPGRNGAGNVRFERWLVPAARLRNWSQRAKLALFTGRTREELQHTLNRFRVEQFFPTIITANDVARAKPDPDGLLRILNGADPRSAVYLGDNIDDALSARQAGVPFIGVLPMRTLARRHRAESLRAQGALAVLGSVLELEKLWPMVKRRTSLAGSANTV
jgi:HAD superfamily phosphatase